MFKSLFETIEQQAEKDTIQDQEEKSIIQEAKSKVNQPTTDLNTYKLSTAEKDFLIELIVLYQKLSKLSLSNAIKPYLNEINNEYNIDSDLINFHLKQVRNLLIENHPELKKYKNDLSDWCMSSNIELKHNNIISGILEKFK
jgi:hypothetical protein